MSDPLIFGLQRTFIRPVVSAGVGAATFSAMFPGTELPLGGAVPQFFKDFLGPSLSGAAAGALMGLASSFICENVGSVLEAADVDDAPAITIAQCFAASAITFIAVPFILSNSTQTPGLDEVARLAAAGVITEAVSRYVFQSMFAEKSAGHDSYSMWG